MVDTIELNSGSGGATLATQDEGGVHYQEVKLTASGNGTTEALSKAEDTQHSSGEHGIMSLAVRNDTLAALAGTDGDYAPIQVNDVGAVYVEIAELAGNAVDLGNGTVDNGTLRVTIASDTTGVLSVDDNGSTLSIDDGGGAITVDGTVSISGSVTVDLGGNNDVTIDNSSIVHAEDSVHNSGDAGVMLLGVRQDSQVDFGADGDYVPFSVNADGELRVTNAAGSGGTSATDDGSFTAGTGAGTPMMGFVTADAVDSGDVGVVAMSTDRRLHVDAQIVGQDADVTIADGGNSITVDNGGTFATQVDGDALTALQLIDNVVHVDDAAFTLGTSSGVMIMGFAGTQSVDANDAGAIAIDTDGAVHISDGGNSITVDNGGTFAVQSTLQTGSNTIGEVTIGAATTAAGDLAKAEDATHSSGDVGVMALAVRDTAPAAVSGTDGDYEPLHVSDDGGVWTSAAASHQGGNSFFSSIDLDESEEDVASSACTVSYMYFWNATAAPLWVQLFNTNTVTVGTTAPDMNFPIPANADSDVAGITIPVPQGGIQFSTALSVAVTTGSGTTAGAPGANEAGGIIIYKD